ncbi:MAG: glycosyltransferase [Candidatus Diapherotrites archaeon]|nr:glycosyltransferase [Candidatus Diapherotrites archaeon]
MLSVIIAAYNEEQNIGRCLTSIRAQDFDDYELIVVVAGKDRTYDIAKEFADKVIRDKKEKGAGPARNIGAKKSRGDVLIFTDGDVVVAKDWLKKYNEVFCDKDVIAAGGAVRTLDGGLLEEIIYKTNSDWLYRITPLFGFYQLSGNNCAYRKEMFMKVGGFDETLSMLEDTELPNRIKRYGKIVFRPDIIVYASARRIMEQGYWHLFFKYMKAYYTLYIKKAPVKQPYFMSALKHNKY